jgi:hypothetical protein
MKNNLMQAKSKPQRCQICGPKFVSKRSPPFNQHLNKKEDPIDSTEIKGKLHQFLLKSKEEAGKKPTFKPPEKMRKLARQAGRADGGRERRQRERAPTEGDSTGDSAAAGCERL